MDTRDRTIHARLKALFLDELLADEGWSAYIDFLLQNLDTSYLELCSTAGFPYILNFADYLLDGRGLFKVSNGSKRFELLPTADFGTVSVVVDSGVLERITEDGVEVYAGGKADVLTLDSEKRYVFFLSNAPSESHPARLVQLYLPEQINPKAILSARKEEYMQPLITPTTSPQALHGAIAELSGLQFRVVYDTVEGSGTPNRPYQDYVRLWNVTEQGSYASFSTDVNVHLDALRDRFGYGEHVSRILGYDKGFCVVESNAPEKNIIGLYARVLDGTTDKITVTPSKVTIPQGGSDPLPPQISVTPNSDTFENLQDTQSASVKVTGPYNVRTPDQIPTPTSATGIQVQVTTTPAAGFTIDPSEISFDSIPTKWLYGYHDGEVKYLLSPLSVVPKNTFGFTKRYDMLTLIDYPLEVISVAFNSAIADLPNPEAFEEALKELLKRSVPAGVQYRVEFVYPQVVSEAQIYDTPQLVQPAIYIDGYTGDEVKPIALGQRAESRALKVQTRPSNFEFDVKLKTQ